MFKVKPLSLEGAFKFIANSFEDNRGSFIKIYHNEEFLNYGIKEVFKEQYYSISKPGVLRGLHFQKPPMDHGKLVTAIKGEVLDVIVDIRKSSKTYGKYEFIELSEENKVSVYIPKGCAHGFYVKGEKEAIMLYSTSTVYSREFDSGINYKSFNIKWPFKEAAIISDKDFNLPKGEFFENPFK